MKRPQGSSQQKVQIVLEGLKDRAVAGICTENQISQAHYDQWHEQFLTNANFSSFLLNIGFLNLGNYGLPLPVHL